MSPIEFPRPCGDIFILSILKAYRRLRVTGLGPGR